ncbi:MAG: DUF4878 domain-containing protein [Bacteroidota bacterium]|nr:DUF4878 domain-containing protein [Ferruginibacter sp.]
MRKLFAILLVSTLLYSCRSAQSGTPTAAVNSFIEAARTGDFEEIKKHISQQDISLMEMGQRFLSNVDSNAANEMKNKFSNEFKEKVKDVRIDVKKETVDGNKATVDVQFTHEGKTDTKPFSLVKEDGQWKISLMSTGMDLSGTNKAEVEEAMKSINIDSLQNAVKEEMGEMSKLDKDSLNKVINEGMKELEKLKQEQKEKQ